MTVIGFLNWLQDYSICCNKNLVIQFYKVSKGYIVLILSYILFSDSRLGIYTYCV